MQGMLTRWGIGLGFVGLMLGGCSDWKKNLGLEREMPNEYEVSPRQQQLEIPPSFDLKPPKKGDARTVSPFQDNPHSKTPKAPLSPGEKALMRDLGPGISPQDQMALDQDAVHEVDELERKKGPLEGKFLSKKAKPGEVINPMKEPYQGSTVHGVPEEEVLPEAISHAVNQ